MALHIREVGYETASGATYPVRPDEVRAHLMILASGGTMDLAPSFGDEPLAGDSDYSLVLYSPEPPPGTATAADRVRNRLLELVSRANAYQIVGVSGDTIWTDGRTVEAQPAFALGSTVFYDTSNCNGNGRWIRGVNGEEECTNSVGMLYHELAHSYHNNPGGVAEVEAQAITDENDLREALGLVLRDPERIEGGCGCPSDDCCIVASVALGSPFAREIQALRRFRDHVVRSTEGGRAFFDALHREYYAFSVDVCRVMVLHPQARSNVEIWLVRPLADSLQILRACAAGGAELQSKIESHVLSGQQPAAPADLESLILELCEGRVRGDILETLDEGTAEVLRILSLWLPHSPHVVWGLIRPLTIRLKLAGYVGDGEKMTRVALEQFSSWMSQMPIDYVRDATSAENWGVTLDTLLDAVVTNESLRQSCAHALAAEKEQGTGP